MSDLRINPSASATILPNYGASTPVRQCGDDTSQLPPDDVAPMKVTYSHGIPVPKKKPVSTQSIPEENVTGHHTNRDAFTSAGFSLSTDMANQASKP